MTTPGVVIDIRPSIVVVVDEKIIVKAHKQSGTKMIKYSKPSDSLFPHKQTFIDENNALLEKMQNIANIYVEQPRRVLCKNCCEPIGSHDFIKMGIGYTICKTCSHLNGCHEDTPEFCSAVYTDDGGVSYGDSYAETVREKFFRRVQDIYEPKAEFLDRGLQECGELLTKLHIVDLGAGSGYFLAALKKIGASRIEGFEVSKSQVELGRGMLGDDSLKRQDLEDTVSIAMSTKAKVVSMIGVLEHLNRPREVLAALSSNPNVHFVYLSVPLFSPCVFLELAFPNIFPRQLAGGHTHLYTEASINHFCREFNFTPSSQWWFGTDIVDLYRNVLVTLSSGEGTLGIANRWKEMMYPLIDDLQQTIDKRHMSSEVHMLLTCKKQGT